LRKMRGVMGRTDDLLIVAGVNFYPSQIESLVLGTPGANGHYQIWLWTEDVRDYIEVRIEAESQIYSDEQALQSLALQVANRLRDNIGIRMAVKVVEPGAIERSQGKARRVCDNREGK
jgi:phenylacetate-CoA ligase